MKPYLTPDQYQEWLVLGRGPAFLRIDPRDPRPVVDAASRAAGGPPGARRTEEWSVGDAVTEAAGILLSGGVVIYPTETFYALGAAAGYASAEEAIFRLKGRAAGRALPWIASDREQVEKVAYLSPLAAKLAEERWPGPFTMVLRLRREAADAVEPAGMQSETAAIRVSSNPIARDLAAAIDYPIISTSANRSGQPPATNAESAYDAVSRLPKGESLPHWRRSAEEEEYAAYELASRHGEAEVMVVLDAGPTPGGAPSTIVDATGDDLVLLRGSL